MISYAQPKQSRSALAVGSAARLLWSVVFWSFLTIPCFAVIGGAVALLLNPATASWGVAALCVICIVAGNSARLARRRRARAILAYLAQAVKMNMPISTLLLAAANSEKPPVARRIQRLKTALEGGSPVGDAVRLAVPQVPQRIVDLSNTAERSGQLPQVLARLLDEHYPAGGEVRARGFYASYALILVLVISALISMIDIFVIPKYEQILKDFKTPMPATTVAMLQFGMYIPPTICLIGLLVTLVAEGEALRQLLSSGTPRANPMRNLWDRLLWHLPVYPTLVRNRDLADACTTIADGINAGRPIEQAIAEAAQPHVNAVLRGRIERWSTLVMAGAPLAQAAGDAHLPQLIGGLMGTAVRAGNMPGTLRFLSRHYESSFSRTAILLHAALVPAVVLTAGAVVLGVALSLFEPMIAILRTASIYTRYW